MPIRLTEKPLSRNAIKYIVVALMFLDHLLIVCPISGTAEFLILFFSRLTAPVMAFFVAEGYAHTHDVGAYMKRMALFALLSALPFTYLTTGHILPVELVEGVGYRETMGIYFPSIHKALVFRGTGVLYTLLLGLVNIYVWDRLACRRVWKVLITAVSLWLAAFGDWDYWDILFCLTFYFLRHDRRKMWTVYGLICLSCVLNISLFWNPFLPRLRMTYVACNWGTLLVIPLIQGLYNGKPGGKNPFHKWFFYWFYPAHLLLLCITKYFQ